MARRRASLTLRPLRALDLDALSSWLPRVATETGCDRWSDLNSLRANDDVLAIAEGGMAGIIAFEAGVPQPDAATVRYLAIDPARRRLGIGGRAALALERRLARSVARIYVAVPARIGLALYFWLRLGYRPLTQREWPAEPPERPSAWMVRELRARR